MKRISLWLFSLLMIGSGPMITACTEDLEFDTGNSNAEYSLTFDVSDGRGWTTRGLQATVSALDAGFGVSASAYPMAGTYSSYIFGSYFSNILTTPNTATSYYWPAAGNKISFFAYYPYGNANLTIKSPSTLGAPIYQYTTPTAVASQVDIMTTQQTDLSCSSPSTVNLTFSHRCADFRFILNNSTGETVTVNSITVKNFYRSGELHESTWTTTGAVQDFTLSVGTDVAAANSLDLTGTSNHFLLIPQTIASGNRLLDLFVTVGEEDKHFYCDLTEAFVAEAGRTYHFALLLKSDLKIQDDIDISDWELLVGYMEYATSTATQDWVPEEQPIERVLSGSISDWKKENP